MAGVDLESLSDKLVNTWSLGQGKYMTPVMRYRSTSWGYRLFQTGYGDTSDSDVHVKIGNGKTVRPEQPPAGAVTQTFQYKRSMPKASATMDKFYLNTKLPNGTELVQTYSGGLELNCADGNNSTYKGDSGGPLLAFPIQGGSVAYLVGVTFGAGLQSAINKSVWEYDNNVATSLGYFYKNLYDLRFQNV